LSFPEHNKCKDVFTLKRGGNFMKFFRRADEMEMSINFKAMRLAYVFENAALLVWAVISQINGDTFRIQISIVLIQNIIFFGSQLYMKRKMANEKKDKNEE
jgi:hypothetical protein